MLKSKNQKAALVAVTSMGAVVAQSASADIIADGVALIAPYAGTAATAGLVVLGVTLVMVGIRIAKRMIGMA